MCSPGEGPRVGQVWKKNLDNWPEGRQGRKRTDLYEWLNCLFTVLLLTRGAPTPFLSGVHLCLASVSWTNCFSTCSPSCCCALSLIINFVPEFSFLFPWSIFHWGQRSRPLAFAALVAKILGFHPGYPGSIPWQGIKILLHAIAHCGLAEIRETNEESLNSVLSFNDQCMECLWMLDCCFMLASYNWKLSNVL